MKSAPWQPLMPLLWWWKKPAYRRYMLRELSAVFIGAYALAAIAGFYCLAAGEQAWAAFLRALATPCAIAGQIIVFCFALYHSVSWFRLAPASMPLWRGERRIAAQWITFAHYLIFLVLSAVIVWSMM